ncbi:MAG: hypothetical protein A2Y45_01170 [Tenericutes bacterium GWC2_34_14]|nr:MAG: hypothetical protein A2Y45_01170 [Tenericutes bacterium GWC2_34_14]OHE34603.1 MAG: hypothetical protein A2012_08790 [Tenericutes bacterium GWE2_34_108]OHE35960.1 MAG: hypothetical protein A2Y46_03495 [Tenericutes bacterium GWF1_35_14]OHE38954.1 MAG: hypothetical protein A2Y44_06435 [Tenericutes bacterium GWF2_35_184]OHE42979.1 MAG: hypothetical protein A2221_09800 [Tenericutes bacterium RIFOXYA2_FULL_36_32]OHE46207.1 MAG: hypothetical protein A2308_01470 [Tenericutes bacterium RIFOXYB2
MKKIIALLMLLAASFGLMACTEEEVTVDRLSVTPPTKVEYIVGDEFDATGMIVKAIFSDGTDRTLTANDFEVTGFSSTAAGLVTITISYEDVEATFGIAVFDPEAPEEALSLNVVSVPTQQIYNKLETFNPAGLVVEVTYNTGRKEVLESSEYTLSGFVQGSVGRYDVVVTFEELTTSFYAEVRNVTVQGVTDTSILVGNTATISGGYSFIGLPFSYGMRAAFEEVNDAGGINGRNINYINKDDGFDGTVGITNTRQLVNEDKVFALVGHFGTPTVSGTLGFIREVGVPMVYAATGVNVLYRERAPLDPVMPVQPIYLTDGRIMTARALNESIYGANNDQALAGDAKVGVLYTTDDAGMSIREGIEIEARTQGKNANFIYSSFATTETAALTTAIENFRSSGVQVVIIATNQVPFKAAIGAMQTVAFNVPVFTSYVNADATAVNAATDYTFPIYTNAWVDIFSDKGTADVTEFVTAIQNASFLTEGEKTSMAANSFAIAGYIAAKIFIEGLERVGDGVLTWESFIKALESEAVSVPMGGSVDFSGGKRWGIDSMSLLKYNPTNDTFEKVREIETLAQIQAK